MGFVGWNACFRLPEPVSAWLLQKSGSRDIAVGIVRLLVMLFLIFSVLLALSLVPLFILTHAPQGVVESKAEMWRNLYGVSFYSSIAGLFALGMIRRARR